MKRILLFLFIAITSFGLYAQTPDGFKYQAVARDGDGNVMANEDVTLTISILQGSVNGTTVYTETHNKTTNSYGLVNLIIGRENSSDNFISIDWANGPYFIQVKLNGNVMGTSQLLSVPYAKYADNSGNVFSGKYADLTNKPDLGIYIDSIQSKNWDKGSTNELQTLRLTEDTLYLTQGNFVILPDTITHSSYSDSSHIADTAHHLVIQGEDGNEYEINIDSSGNLYTDKIKRFQSDSGTFVDQRDGQEYEWVKIGDQVWMAENLNYDQSSFSNWCYNNDPTNCEKYGRLYEWYPAMQDLCPDGWHLPSKKEWKTLIKYVSNDGYSGIEGKALKSITGWVSEGNGLDVYGFTALAGGNRTNNFGNFGNLHHSGNWWTSTEKDGSYAWQIYLTYLNEDIVIKEVMKTYGFSVRCIKD